MGKPTGKIIQVATMPAGTYASVGVKPSFLAVCEDGSLWNLLLIDNNQSNNTSLGPVELDWKCVYRPEVVEETLLPKFMVAQQIGENFTKALKEAKSKEELEGIKKFGDTVIKTLQLLS